MQTLLSLSNDLAGAVERAARSLVAVHARPRLPSTGVHWRPGIVVTAEHTVRVDEEIRVAWPDGRAAPATLVARDPGTDLAVLRIDDTDWPIAEVGDSAGLGVGNLVLAVGYGPRASWGVVSAVGGAWRTWRGGEVDRFLRVDLVLYPGFSGGPLVDASGKVAGLVTSGLSRHLELAVPASTVTRVVDELLTSGRISRAYLGLGLQPVLLPEALRRLAPGAGAHALIVVSIEADGPAASAGVMLGVLMV
jgi:S1-C subfamily serine protease